MTPKPEPPSASYTRLSPSAPSYHLYSSVSAIIWSIFIIATLITFELTHSATWDYDRVAANKPLPWSFTGLPSIMRTVFDQGHGPITAMHLARLAVGSLDTSWTSANTWLEVFWLADRRWAGPFGLWTVFETFVTRKWRQLRGPRISIGFWLFAALSVVALVTPVALSRAYHVTTGEVERQVTVSRVYMMNVGEIFDSTKTSVSELPNPQTMYGTTIWQRGVAPAVQFRDSMYAKIDNRSSSNNGDWFISGNSRRSQMRLVGIRVSGGCELLQPSTFEDICTANFGDSPSLVQVVTPQNPNYKQITSCTNNSTSSSFKRDSRSTALALFRIRRLSDPKRDVIVRCNATTELGEASVDGRTMSFSNFTSIALSDDFNNWYQYVNPLASVIQSNFAGYVDADMYKKSEDKLNPDTQSGSSEEAAREAELMWNSVLATTIPIWIESARPADVPGVQTLTVTGIRRDGTYLWGLSALLGIWFVGMLASSAALLRRTWTSSLDGYAAARLLRQQPVLAETSETWFAELEENEDMLQRFTMREWRASGS